jgi:HTH-type transcriptional regulator / antitoxin HigA
MPSTLDPATLAAYLELVRAFPLLSIQDDEHLSEATAVIDRLIEQSDLSAAEDAYLGALTDLVETYEDAHVSIPPTSGVDALRHLLEANDLAQAELAPLFGGLSVISEVLSGKRRLSLMHIKRLAARFGLPADVFMDALPTPARHRP